jgi:hypothetical protein
MPLPKPFTAEMQVEMYRLRDQGLTWEQVAQRLGVSRGTVRTQRQLAPRPQDEQAKPAGVLAAPPRFPGRGPDPLPAGHPISAGAIGLRPWYVAPQRVV